MRRRISPTRSGLESAQYWHVDICHSDSAFRIEFANSSASWDFPICIAKGTLVIRGGAVGLCRLDAAAGALNHAWCKMSARNPPPTTTDSCCVWRGHARLRQELEARGFTVQDRVRSRSFRKLLAGTPKDRGATELVRAFRLSNKFSALSRTEPRFGQVTNFAQCSTRAMA